MAKFTELEVVRVKSLSTATLDSSLSNRSPAAGDVATIVSVLSDDRFTLECMNEDGTTAWLCDFSGIDLATEDGHLQ
jgi:hypothetical protein